jgi:hypothetical protein
MQEESVGVTASEVEAALTEALKTGV